jgi:5-oxoprolinase (ATP-hydrolysing) subunit A
MKINLNADLGESFGVYTIGHDRQLLQIVASANVACGFHAGDPLVMAKTVELARDAGVTLGAHPSFPDLQGFGRREMHISPRELGAILLYQIGALDGIARAQGSRVSHVKPHGALNNMASADAEIAAIIAKAVKEYDKGMILLAPVLSALAAAGMSCGLPVALEVFADRAYTDRGQLVPRSQPGSVIHDPADALTHVTRMIEQKGIVSINGTLLPTEFHSICVHGDNIHAAEAAALIRTAVETLGCTVVPLPDFFY